MSQRSEDGQDMRAQYDIRGGVRGKYFEPYRQGTTFIGVITFEESPFIAKSTATAASVGSITRIASHTLPQPSPKIQIGILLPTVHEG
jgi:hypothetical protein